MPEATPINRPAEQRSRQAADASDDDGDEARHQKAGPHGRFEAELTGRQHAGEAGEEDAEREIEAAQRPHIDAERGDRVQIEGAGTDAHPQSREAQEQEQPADRERHYGDHE